MQIKDWQKKKQLTLQVMQQVLQIMLHSAYHQQ